METRRYRVGLDLKKYYRNFAIACVSCLILGAGAVAVTGYAYFYDLNESLVTEYENQLQEQKTRYELEVKQLEADVKISRMEVETKTLELQEQLDELNRIFQESDEQADADFALLRKYWYLLRDAPNNGTINLDHIRYLDNQCRKWDINPHWMWFIYYHESRWITTAINSSSGARGLGQVMPSTGKYMWETVMGHSGGSFSYSSLDNPYVNIEITVMHLGRDIKNGSSFLQAMDHYSGGIGQQFINECISMARSHGVTISASNYRYQ